MHTAERKGDRVRKRTSGGMKSADDLSSRTRGADTMAFKQDGPPLVSWNSPPLFHGPLGNEPKEWKLTDPPPAPFFRAHFQDINTWVLSWPRMWYAKALGREEPLLFLFFFFFLSLECFVMDCE